MRFLLDKSRHSFEQRALSHLDIWRVEGFHSKLSSNGLLDSEKERKLETLGQNYHLIEKI